MWGINFTGHTEYDLLPCPAERRRSLETIESWEGNVATHRGRRPSRVIPVKGTSSEPEIDMAAVAIAGFAIVLALSVLILVLLIPGVGRELGWW